MRKYLICAVMLCLSCSPQRDRVRNYISDNWEATLRYFPADSGTLIGLPEPYTVPCADGMFNELYYWDTYFTNEGLILDGRVELARQNTDDILYMVDKFGYMYNGNRIWYASRSQPPYLSAMVRSVFARTRDTLWLGRAYPILEKEYSFWQTGRTTPCGLNRYWCDAPDSLVTEMIITAGRRLGDDFTAREDWRKFSLDCVAECESGWDFNPRFERRCGDFCPVDLNAHLYRMERDMAAFAKTLGKEKKQWEDAAAARKRLMLGLMYDPQQDAFFDWDYVEGRRSGVLSAAVFTLLFDGVLDGEQAVSVVKALEALETAHGLAVCEDRPYPYSYQWSWPQAWPPLTFMAVKGLAYYGYMAEAERLARKYIDTARAVFERTGTLWEKYNAVTGEAAGEGEYDTPAMLGWTAGTYIFMDELLKHNVICFEKYW